MKKTYCDECYSEIEDGKCYCGIWYEPGESPPFMNLTEKTLLAFDLQVEQGILPSIFSGLHHSGTCVIFFKGDYDLCENVKEFIRESSNER